MRELHLERPTRRENRASGSPPTSSTTIRGYGVNADLAKQTETDSEDLSLFGEAFQNRFDYDRSAARGMMALQGLYVFSHDSALGNARAHRLFEHICGEVDEA